MRRRKGLSRCKVLCSGCSNVGLPLGAQPKTLRREEAADGIEQAHRSRLDRHIVERRAHQPHAKAEHLSKVYGC